MSDVLIVSCRLCLEPDELPSMVTIDRLLSNPPRTVSATVCRTCARLISETLDAVYLLGVQEAKNNAPDGSHSSRGETADLDRPEPEVPAGGADGERASEKG
jgi:hypothetical protein